jgi:predicted acyltransferase
LVSLELYAAAFLICTFWDLIQPAFTFMVGMAMPFALSRRLADGAPRLKVFGHVAWRALMLIVLSNIYLNWGAQPGTLPLQFINVLCQIAFGYVLSYFIVQLRFRLQAAVAALLLAGYWALFAAFPGPRAHGPRPATSAPSSTPPCSATTTPATTPPSISSATPSPSSSADGPDCWSAAKGRTPPG